MIKLKPFWSYFGGKYRAAPKYPKPIHDTIIEPFAGAAGYSLRHYDKNIILYEKYEIIAGIWDYLIKVPESEVRSIPFVDSVDELPSWVPQEARWLIGFNMNDGTIAPSKRLSSGQKMNRENGRKFKGWGEGRRERVATQVNFIRHWKVKHTSYESCLNKEATWFIDPPYYKAGHHYVHSNIDYNDLAKWCSSRDGQVIVCEGEGASWLPFKELGSFRSFGAKKGVELIWTNGG